MPGPSPGRRGTRPRNRRELILAAAADLFAKYGYAKVGTGDLANAVGIAPSALYRHFTGKQDVLAKVLAAGLTPVRELVLGLDLADPAAAAAELASCALDQRHLGLMWSVRRANSVPTRTSRSETSSERSGKGWLTTCAPSGPAPPGLRGVAGRASRDGDRHRAAGPARADRARHQTGAARARQRVGAPAAPGF